MKSWLLDPQVVARQGEVRAPRVFDELRLPFNEYTAMTLASLVGIDIPQIKLVEVSGTYLASSGPMMKVKNELPDYTLIGAIVEAPEGNVFFKMTGPQKIIEAERGSFLTMLKMIN